MLCFLDLISLGNYEIFCVRPLLFCFLDLNYLRTGLCMIEFGFLGSFFLFLFCGIDGHLSLFG